MGKPNLNLVFTIATVIFSESLIANAGVILDKKPMLKNYVEDKPVITSKPKPSSQIQSDKNSKSTNSNETKNSDFNISPQTIALPGTILGITSLAYLAYTLDSEFASFVDKSSLRPSDIYGAGYESELKGGASSASSDFRKISNK